MEKSELRQIIKEEIRKLNERKLQSLIKSFCFFKKNEDLLKI